MDGDREKLSSPNHLDSIDADEMKTMLYERLHNKGLLDSLKVCIYLCCGPCCAVHFIVQIAVRVVQRCAFQNFISFC